MDKETVISTNRLFHYTSSKKILISILNNGFQTRFSLEKLGIIKKNGFLNSLAKILNRKVPEDNITDEFAIPMCCFCDIPLNLVYNHVKVYGEYSIGLKKDWGEKLAICPVIYLPDYGETRALFENLIRNHKKNIRKLYDCQTTKRKENKFREELLCIDVINFYDIIVDLSMFVKPYSGFFEKGNYKNDNHKFYDEREWRYKPDKMLFKSYMTKQEYDSFNSSDERNKNMQNIDFDLADITDIIVPENEVINLRNLITKLPKYKNLDVKIIDSLKNKIKSTSPNS
ncbi:MAG: hypothetical protein IMY72_07930 [Bacteroidetes bacterium]|nr:hypothetical protein [Bacteroidota bacterium]